MKKINRKGFFLSETMIVIAVVAVVILSVFKLFNSVYYGFMQTEDYNTVNAINALSNVQKYYESLGDIDTTDLTDDSPYINLTDKESYKSNYYTRLKEEFNISSIYLIDLNKYFSSNKKNEFYVLLRRYINTLKNVDGTILLVSINGKEFAYTQIKNYTRVNLIGNKDDEYVVYVPIGNEFVDPGYTNWEGEEPIKTWENDKELDTSKAGTYYLIYDFNGYLLKRKIIVDNFVTDFEYTGNYQIFDIHYDGIYKVELWGAQGGNSTSTLGGKGAYSYGNIHLNKGEKLYVYIGEQPTTLTGGYNGGGTAGTSYNAAGGGGSTDIRYFGTYSTNQNDLIWSSTLGLNSRIIVAGGGGGSDNYKTGSNGGIGGTLIGGDGGFFRVSGTSNEYTVAKGGEQILGGSSAIGAKTNESGSFGIGGSELEDNDHGGGGGAGYYGGGAGSYNSSVVGSGAGGSSFISGYAGVNAITSSSDRTHTNNTMHYSNKYFIDGEMQEGVNTGNGKAKITFLGENYEKKNTKLDGVRYIKDCVNGNSKNVGNYWVEVQAIKNGVNQAYGKPVKATSSVNTTYGAKKWEALTDGDINSSMYAQASVSGSLQCVTVDLEDIYDLDEIAVWHYYASNRSYNNHSLYVSSDNTNFTTLINNVSGVVETANGIRISAYR